MAIVRELKLFIIFLKVYVLGKDYALYNRIFLYEGVWCHLDGLTILRSTIFSRKYRIYYWCLA